MRNAITAFIGVLVTTLACAPATRAAPVEFTLDPARSTFRLGGTFNGAPLSAQSPGTDLTGFEGVLSVDINPPAGTLSILTGIPRAVDQPADQRPFHPSYSGAKYGLQTAAGDNLLAVRGFDLYLRATDAPFNAGPATSDEVGFFINGGTLNYSTPANPALYADLHGYGSLGRVVDFVRLTRDGDTETLTLPISTQFSPYTYESGNDITFTFAGQLVAVRPVPEPTAALVLGLALLTRRPRSRLKGH